MLLAAHDQENAILHAPNQNGKQQKLHQFPKTPGANPKTPFARGGKLIVHGNENNVLTGKGKGKSAFAPGADAFVTPAGPRNRVPLGGKDTNFKTRKKTSDGGVPQKAQGAMPGPVKQGSAKASHALKQSTTIDSIPAFKPADNDDYPEIEYMPPKSIDLPDLPEDYRPVNVDFIRSNLYKDIHRDTFDSYAKMADDLLHNTDVEDRIIAEEQERDRKVLERELKYNTIGRTRGKKVASAKKAAAAAASADKENKVQRGALKPKNTSTVTNIKAGGKDVKENKQMALHAKTYSTSNATSIHRRMPSRPNSAQAVRAASALSQHAPSRSKSPAPVVHKRSSSSASILNKVTGGIVGKPAPAYMRQTVDPRIAEMNSKTSVGYSAGRPMAQGVQRALAKDKKEDVEPISSEDEESDEEEEVGGNNDDNFDDLFQAAGIDINRIDEEDEDFELVL